MTTAVPSVEDVTNAFPTAVTKITGEPNYESLKNLKDELKANAASIPTTLGGGTHGYLGLILSPAAYAVVSMFSAHIFYAKIVDDEAECDRSPLMAPQSRCVGDRGIAILA